MKARHKEALRTLGVTTAKYVLQRGIDLTDSDAVCAPDTWGLSLTLGDDALFVEHRRDEYGAFHGYVLCTRKGDATSDIGRYTRQQDAIAVGAGRLARRRSRCR